ncbi:Flagellar motility protein MotE, a chaperone for MotC folding [Pelagirhabdus alkalitolerans]|uniref:Flagellar motility protein MotE, a chaperone for MotC folding n=1 Tax=Pelagirhabdus alkalitolerans TaxID=1612202 RepID=A0A1G6H2X4_9BACI|nr:hypothetical protein [Pelagirhabdus alkalitolerans]SDB88660.1 Flagellar motility protein MotE, a chaperone for MotC folding [Pelagirhabdus alkalitolerans]
MAQKSNNEKPKRANLIQWLFLILVPLVLVVVIMVILFSLLDIDPVARTREFANSVPIVNQWVTSEEEEEFERRENRYINQIDELEQEIDQLEAELMSKSSEVDDLNQEIVSLNQQIEDLLDDAESEEELDANFDQLVMSYQEMAPANAANILSNASNQVVVRILESLEGEQRADILSAMEPELAAEITEQLMND